jgi:GT2 family glycosyltransferase/SAM-dependent methyltransferase
VIIVDRAAVRASFDQYARYAYLRRIRRDCYGPQPLRILDVGDPFGTIAPLFPDDTTVSVDVWADQPADPSHRARHSRLVGSGFALPLADASFDLAACHDVFEHLPADRRTGFVAELLRVSRGPVLVLAPFADPRVTRCEQLVNGYFTARVGHSLTALDEHAAFGLPDLAELTGWLRAEGLDHRVHADGWLDHWVAFWALKTHLLAEGREDDLHRVDAAFNTRLREADRRAPHYRHAVVIRPPVPYPSDLPPVGDPPAPAELAADAERLSGLALQLQQALPHGTDPFAPDSALQHWIAAGRLGGDPDRRAVAEALGTVLAAAAAERPGPVHAGPPAEREPEPRSVAVVIVNLNGVEHLRTCLDSLLAQDYPAELLDIVVVDNASTDGSPELLARDYPTVRVLPQDTNTGFSPAVNTGARATDAECLVLLNNDARVEPDFVRELVRAYDPATGAVCVGAHIVSWDGTTLDFGEGAVNFYGMGQQLGFGTPISTAAIEDGRELLFACGGAMLVDRRIFVDSGGLDEDFFAYFEDVDFGWRLWVLGYRVVLAAKAKAYHKMHGTSSRFPTHQRYLLYERNALRTIIKNYDDANLEKVLAPSLLLLVKRALLRGGLPRAPYDIGGDGAPTETVPRIALAHLHAVGDVVEDLDELYARRAMIQRARRRPDTEILPRFNRPLWPVLPERPYLEASERVTGAFGLDQLFDRRRASRVLVVSNDAVGGKMSGPAIRAWEIARALGGVAEVTVAVPAAADRPAPNVSFAVYADPRELVELAEAADVTLVQGYTLHRVPALAKVPTLLVVDLYDPWLFENLELHTGDPEADRALHFDAVVLNELIDAGDFFICASERQRDYWLGLLSSRGRLTEGHYEIDRTLRLLIDVVPFGLPDHRPRRDHPVLKGVHPSIGPDDKVVLWGGGSWDWFDPVGAVEAFAEVVREVPEAKLYFLGFQLASANVKPMRVAEQTRRRVDELGLDKSVIFGDWAPYDEREAYLVEADVALSAARDLAETRLSFRTRVLDYLWAGLPIVATSGDVLSDLVRDEQLGLVVPPGDSRALAAALVRMLRSPALRAECSANAAAVARRYAWPTAVEPLRRVVLEPWRWEDARRLRPRHRQLTEEVRGLLLDRNRVNGAYGTGRLRGRILLRDRDFGSLEEYVGELEATVQQQDRRLALLRRTPVYPAFKAARRARNWARARLGPDRG